jgi:hypothetical protein
MTTRRRRSLRFGIHRTFSTALAIAAACGLSPERRADAQEPAAPAPGGVSIDLLQRMSPGELEAVYRQGFAAAIPEGRIRGTALLAPGTRRSRMMSRGARLIWQGKVIEPGESSAVNRFFGVRAVRGQLYEGPSWLDGQPSLVLDYSQTSRVYASNRDEIRQVAPGLYLGLMYDRTIAPPKLVMYFALEQR